MPGGEQLNELSMYVSTVLHCCLNLHVLTQRVHRQGTPVDYHVNNYLQQLLVLLKGLRPSRYCHIPWVMGRYTQVLIMECGMPDQRNNTTNNSKDPWEAKRVTKGLGN